MRNVYVLEFDDDAMSYMDYCAVSQYENTRIPLEFVEDLQDYVAGMGYDWNTVCYVRSLAVAS